MPAFLPRFPLFNTPLQPVSWRFALLATTCGFYGYAFARSAPPAALLHAAVSWTTYAAALNVTGAWVGLTPCAAMLIPELYRAAHTYARLDVACASADSIPGCPVLTAPPEPGVTVSSLVATVPGTPASSHASSVKCPIHTDQFL